MKTRVMLADDHETFRRELRAIIDRESDMAVVGEAANGKEAVELARRLVPDVVIMDINMRFMNGIDATLYLSKELPSVNVLILSMHSSPYLVKAVKGSGARGYALKDVDSDELVEAVRRVSKKLPYWSAGLTVDE
ncbi:MAG TPA: response regulator transcription factor [Syntrophales bacterium]|nr:response regulator transcription factor [Syntrophales bacterium]